MSSDKSFFSAFLGTASLQIMGRGIAVITGVIFARALGPEEFGRYSLVLSIIALLTLPAIAGIPSLVVRETSRYHADGKLGLLLGMWAWATRYIIVISGFMLLLSLGLVYTGIWPENIVSLMLPAVMLIPFKGLLPKFVACINGLQRPELAQIPLVIFCPLMVILLFGFCYFLGFTVDAYLLLELQVIAHAVAILFSVLLLNKIVKLLSIQGRNEYSKQEWFASLLPFSLVAVAGTLNNELATVFLGLLGSDESIGYFKVAMQGIIVLALGLQAVNTVSGPRIARMYRLGQFSETQKLLRKSARLSFISSVPLAVFLMIFGSDLIKILFGDAYLLAANLLAILCIGQIVNVSMGSVGLVLNMTGNEKRTLRAQVITIIVTVILLSILIPFFEATGAAISVSIGLAVWNFIMAYDVYRLTGLKTWIH